MQPQSPFAPSRLRQVITISLVALGLALFLGLGGKAISQINDPDFVYGKPRIAGKQSPQTLVPPVLAASTYSINDIQLAAITTPADSANPQETQAAHPTPQEANDVALVRTAKATQKRQTKENWN
jgi:hypothetical protein